jgi:septal ring factor EnvC (AmiA/AmiB activator)
MVDEDIKRRIEKVEDYIPKIFGELSTIRTKVEIPHTCKWEAVIPVLVDFKNKADVRLDKTDKEVEALKENLAKQEEISKQNNELLKKLVESKEKEDKEKLNESKSTLDKWKDRGWELAKAIGLIIFGFILPFLIVNLK